LKTDDLIEQLARDTTRVQPLASPGTRTAVWVTWAVAYLVVVAFVMFQRMSAPGFVGSPLYLFQQAAALVTGITAARAAFLSVVPGRRTGWFLPAWGGSVWIALLLWQGAADLQTLGTFGFARESDWPCVVSMVAGGVLLGAPLIWMLNRGAPLTPRASALLAGVAALSFANLEACLTRGHMFASTVLLWHGGTIAATAAVLASTGRLWLKWRTAAVPGLKA
jgi:hypothetical protein